MNRNTCMILISAVLLAACSQTDESQDVDATGQDYVVMGDDLQQLKDDFNASQGRTRLVFLSGPTCGICLRGLADLNDAFIAESQSDDRLVTFVVHVPTMGQKNTTRPTQFHC